MIKYSGAADLAQWAHVYKSGGKNPSDTFWLRPGKWMEMVYVDETMTWKWNDSPDLPEFERVICALLWDECRDIKTVRLTFEQKNGKLPQPDQVTVCVKNNHTVFEDARRWRFDFNPVYLDRIGTSIETGDKLVLEFQLSGVDATTKLYVSYLGESEVAMPKIEAYGTAVWKDPVEVEFRWNGGNTGGAGMIFAHNGIAEIKNLVKGTAKKGDIFVCSEGENRVTAEVTYLAGGLNCATALTLWCDNVRVSVNIEDLLKGPVYIPSLDVYVRLSGQPEKEDFLPTLTEKTVRQKINEFPEPSLEETMRHYFGDKPLYKFPYPPFEPPMKITVPDQFITGQWRLSAWHFMRHSQPMPDGTLCVSIWPFDKGKPPRKDGNEGVASIGTETEKIIRALDLIGLHDEAKRGLDYWLKGERATPFFRFGEVMGEDTLTNPTNGFNKRSPGYDQKHCMGHGAILYDCAFHYRITEDDVWLNERKERIAGACRAIGRLRAELKKHIGPDSWVYGLLPPSTSGDLGEIRINYAVNEIYCRALDEMSRILACYGCSFCDLMREAQDFKESLKRAAELSAALSPVIKVGDGTYRRNITWYPYARRFGPNLPWSADPIYFEATCNGIRLTHSLFDPDDPIVGEMLDVLEDVVMKNKAETDQQLRFEAGYIAQPGLEMHKNAYALRSEAVPFLRAVFNSYAAEIDPDRAYIFWEGPKQAGAADKTFEEAAFIEHIRNMLIREDGEDLLLADLIPNRWLGENHPVGVENAPTFFGETSYLITPSPQEITIDITLPKRRLPQRIKLRLRLPLEKAVTASYEGKALPVKDDCIVVSCAGFNLGEKITIKAK